MKRFTFNFGTKKKRVPNLPQGPWYLGKGTKVHKDKKKEALSKGKIGNKSHRKLFGGEE